MLTGVGRVVADLHDLLAKAKADAAAAEMNVKRLEIGAAHGLDVDSAMRLTGVSDTELHSHARDVAAVQATANLGVFTGTGFQTPPPAPKPTAEEIGRQHSQLLGQLLAPLSASPHPSVTTHYGRR